MRAPPEKRNAGGHGVGSGSANLKSWHQSDTTAAAAIQGDNRLPILAAEIRHANAESQRASRLSIESAIKAGEALIEAKGCLKHGAWLPWLRDNCELPERTARLYMRLARRKDELSKSATVADLTIREAISLLDDRTELERALTLEAEQEGLRKELALLGTAIDTAEIPELVRIIERAQEIHTKAARNRLLAMEALGRLLLAREQEASLEALSDKALVEAAL
jgi:DUF3102 family protein